MSTVQRIRGHLAAHAFGSVVTLTDLLPPYIRYGYVHRLTRRLFSHPIPAVQPLAYPSRPQTSTRPRRAGGGTTCILATDHLDIGGVGSVVEMLSLHLASWGVEPVVLSPGIGSRAARLQAAGIEVISVSDEVSASVVIGKTNAGVIQLHSAPPFLEDAAVKSGMPVIPVLHNTEIHFTRTRWARFGRTLARSTCAIAVSETVREFHARHVPAELRSRLVVVPNGVPAFPDAPAGDSRDHRRRLAELLGTDLDGAVVFLTLARYDAQKNVPGTVSSFLRAAELIETPIYLVVAGEPSDWAEFRRADGIRRGSRLARRVGLLGNSDATSLLRASDAFLLNSFFEGWPVAATEASAAGLPLLMSDVGGAAELVALSPGRSVMVPNPSGHAGSVTDARVASARRRSSRQRNREDIVDAIRTVVGVVLHERERGNAEKSPDRPPSVDDMARGHAELIVAATAMAPPRR